MVAAENSAQCFGDSFASNAAQPILDFPSNVSLGTNSIRIGVKLADLFGQEIGCVAHAQSKSRKFVIHSDENEVEVFVKCNADKDITTTRCIIRPDESGCELRLPLRLGNSTECNLYGKISLCSILIS